MHKKDKKLVNIATFEAGESIKREAEAKNDEDMLHTPRSVNDLIAAISLLWFVHKQVEFEASSSSG